MKNRRRIIKISIVFLAAFFIWISAAPFAATCLTIEKPLEKAGAILVLGGSATYIERTRKAAELFRSGVSETILLTDDGTRGGWSQTELRNPPFVELAKSELIKQGVPAANIEILQPPVSGTIDEARVLAATVEAKNLHSVLLVTSAYHTRRALWICEKVTRENNREIRLGIVSPETGLETPKPVFWWLSPKGWNFVAGEYVKILGYWMYY